MAFALPLPARTPARVRARPPHAGARWNRLRWGLPALLLGGGVLLLQSPWTAEPAGGGAAVPAPLAPPVELDPAALVGALCVVAAALFGLPWCLRRLTPAARGGGQIAVLETRALGGRKQLLLVEVGGRRLLLGASEAGIHPLARLDRLPGDAAGEATEADGGGAAFDRALAAAGGKESP